MGHTRTHTRYKKNVISFFPFLIQKEWMSPGFVWRKAKRKDSHFSIEKNKMTNPTAVKQIVDVCLDLAQVLYQCFFVLYFSPSYFLRTIKHRLKVDHFRSSRKIRIYDHIYWSTTWREQTNTIFCPTFHFYFILTFESFPFEMTMPTIGYNDDTLHCHEKSNIILNFQNKTRKNSEAFCYANTIENPGIFEDFRTTNMKSIKA